MPDPKLFDTDPRDYALALVEEGLVSADHLLLCAVKYMSHDDVREMLDCNELSPRFDEDYDTDEDWSHEDPPLCGCGARHWSCPGPDND